MKRKSDDDLARPRLKAPRRTVAAVADLIHQSFDAAADGVAKLKLPPDLDPTRCLEGMDEEGGHWAFIVGWALARMVQHGAPAENLAEWVRRIVAIAPPPEKPAG